MLTLVAEANEMVRSIDCESGQSMSSDNGSINEGLGWLAKNRGFASLVIGFSSVVMSIVGACVVSVWWASAVIHNLHNEISTGQANHLNRMVMIESRTGLLEANQKEIVNTLRVISDEQIRRSSEFAQMREIGSDLKQIIEKLKREQ